MRGQVDAPDRDRFDRAAGARGALELYGGKGVLNSINFEDGEEPADGAAAAGPQASARR